MEKYLTSNEFYEKNALSFLLYKVVNQSLDKIIKKVGVQRFNKALKVHKDLISLVCCSWLY